MEAHRSVLLIRVDTHSNKVGIFSFWSFINPVFFESSGKQETNIDLQSSKALRSASFVKSALELAFMNLVRKRN